MPKAKLLDDSAKVPGTDGEKMSKSYNNTLEIFEDPQGAAQEDHADRDRLAADGPAEGARQPITCSSSIRWWPPTTSAKRWPPCIAAAASATAK